MRILQYAVVSVLLLLASCSGSHLPPDVRFCPREDCVALLVDSFEVAQRSVDCAFYDLSHENITAELQNLEARGIAVRLVLDRKNEIDDEPPYDYSHIGVSSGLMHHKFCVIDGKRVITGSMNPTFRGAHVNSNNLVLLYSPSIAKQYKQEFEELWDGVWPGDAQLKVWSSGRKRSIDVFFCPEDDCRSAIVHELKEAEESIRVMAFSFTDSALGTELILAHHRNVSVGVLFDVRQNMKYSQLPRLELQNIGTRMLSGKGFLHHKVWIIDGETVITGSFNPSWSAIAKNEENVVVVRDVALAERFLHEFALLWEEANPKP